MITQLEVGTSRGNAMKFPLSDPANGYIVQDITGLDPVKATLVATSFANMDGEQFHSARREARDIKITLGLDTGNALASVSALRRSLYDYFMPKTHVTLRFRMSDGLVVDIRGRVETFETPLFTKDPAVEINVRCFDPDFYEPSSVILEGRTASDTVNVEGRKDFQYNGTVETGFIFRLNVDRPLGEFTIYHDPVGLGFRTLEFSAALQIGDIITISTVPGDKYATVTRGGEIRSILYAISPQSQWSEFQPGRNLLRIFAEGAGIPYSVEYTNKYGGL